MFAVLLIAVPFGVPAFTITSKVIVMVLPVAKTDAIDGDVAQLLGNAVFFNVGTGATSSIGGDLAPGATVTVTFDVRVNSDAPNGSNINNIAIANYNNSPGGTPVSVPSNPVGNSIDNPARLTIVKTVTNLTTPGSTVYGNDILRYTITITNVGGDTSSNTYVTDMVPNYTNYINGTLKVVAGANAGLKTDAIGDDTAQISGTMITFYIGTGANSTTGGNLASGQSTTVTFDVLVPALVPNQVTITNTATLNYNNTPTGGTPVTTPSNPTSAPVSNPGRLVVVTTSDNLTVPGPLAHPGDLIRYTITVTNVGGENVGNVILRDIIPNYTNYVPGTLVITTGPNAGTQTDAVGDNAGQYNVNIVTFFIGTGSTAYTGGTLIPGGNTIVTFDVRMTPDAPNNANITNVPTYEFTPPSTVNPIMGTGTPDSRLVYIPVASFNPTPVATTRVSMTPISTVTPAPSMTTSSSMMMNTPSYSTPLSTFSVVTGGDSTLRDDSAAIIVTPAYSTESGSNVVNVLITQPPTSAVTLNLLIVNHETGESTIAKVSFQPDDWSSAKSVVIPDKELYSVMILSEPASSADPQYNGLNPVGAEISNQKIDK